MKDHIALRAGLLLAVSILPAVAGPAWAQEEDADKSVLEQSAESEGVFFETVDVNVVNVEVYVTDKQGNSVTGLTVDDFEILENKRPVKITNFFTVEEGKPALAERPAPVATPALPVDSGLPAQVPEFVIPQDQRLYLVVYIDNYNIRPFNRNRVFRRLREFLSDKLSEGDQVMLVSYDRELHYRHPFTGSPELIARALFELEDVTGHAVHADSDRRDILRDIADAQYLADVEWKVRTYAESRFNDLSFTVDAMTDIVDSLAGLPGRKALLYVSDGLEAIVADDMFQALHRSFDTTSVLSTAMEFNANRMFERLAAKANTNRVTFYTIDAAGLRVAGASSVEIGTADEAALASFIDSIYISNLQAPLLRLAEATGGQAIVNTNDVGSGLDKVASDFNTYYSLGYVPAHSGDGRYHKIQVRLKEKQKGWRIRHREGYRDKPITARMSDGALATLVYGFEDNPHELAIRVESSTPDDRGKSRYFFVDVVLDIPIGQLELVPIGDFHVGQTKVFFAAMDAEGGTSEVSEVPLSLRIPNEQVETAMEQLYAYKVTLRMRPGPHRLAVAMIDEISATRSFVSRSFTVGG